MHKLPHSSAPHHSLATGSLGYLRNNGNNRKKYTNALMAVV